MKVQSTDITSSARLATFSRFCEGDELCDETVALLTLSEHTTGAEICKATVNELSSQQIDISKVVSVTTDGAPSMTCEKVGFINPFAKEVGHTLIGFHCILHEEVLCAKAGLKELQEVMQTVTKVVNYISAQALNERQCQVLLNEGSSMTPDVMFGYIKAFEMKLDVFKKDVDNERFRYFPNLKRYINDLSKDDRTLSSQLLSSILQALTYACESLFSVMNFVKSCNRSNLTDETSSTCISLKVMKYKPDTKSLSSVMQQQKSH
ncbi:protein FAM200A-like [Octopus bimaculoides]|uniref:protein FAM200A-like n=1 Tax=Octopus bimaculoides TaxID=37653 RepID=UPI00071DE7F9|nr:protein FAM200A-like [Octopus bimaculoides]|eukprot:XP_014768374.1 PREDICTED: protein FAM200A-like [Octopus bimaculoides]